MNLTSATYMLLVNPSGVEPSCPCCRFVTALELAVRFGKTLIVEDVDTLPPLMQPLISGDLQGHGSSTTVCIGDRTTDHNKDFKLILSTRNCSPGLLLGAEAYLSVVNFTVTRYAIRLSVLQQQSYVYEEVLHS